MIQIRRPSLALALALAIAACGGSGATNAPNASSSATDTPPPSQAPGASPTDAPEATPGETQSGGGITADACDLASPDEVGGVVDQDGLTIGMNTPGDVSYCIYQTAAGDAYVATTLMKRGGSGAFSIWKSGAGVQEVDGLGDDAVFDPSSATLLVLKGDAIFSVTAGDGSVGESQRLDWSKGIAEIALGHM